MFAQRQTCFFLMEHNYHQNLVSLGFRVLMLSALENGEKQSHLLVACYIVLTMMNLQMVGPFFLVFYIKKKLLKADQEKADQWFRGPRISCC